MDLEKFRVNHLLDYELEYELNIRFVYTERGVDDKRKMLSKLLKKELNNPGSQINMDSYKVDFMTEQTEINKSLSSITSLISDFEGSSADSTFLRVKSRLAHLSGRVRRIVISKPNEEEIIKFKNESYATCLKLESDLDEKTVSISNTQNLNDSFEHNSVAPIVNVSPVVSCSANKQPISSWGIKFNGDSKSVYYFLERVSDLAQSRNFSEIELFNSAVEFFIGDAFVWYRSVRSIVTDWQGLVKRLKNDFLPPCADDDIWEQIRQRKQKRNESITIFIAHLENLFSRLSLPPAEITKVKYIRKNLLPEYINQLALHTADSVNDLSILCKRLEEVVQLTSQSVSKKNSHLSYLDDSQPSTSTSVYKKQFHDRKNVSTSNKNSFKNNVQKSTENSKDSKSKIICFNCNLPNHTYNSCREKRKLFCFRCGEPNVKVSNCSKCSKN